MKRPARGARWWLLVALWMGLIFLASTDLFSFRSTGQFLRPLLLWFFPGLDEPTLQWLQFAIRKLAHMTEYGILAALVYRAIRGSAGTANWAWNGRHAAMTWLLCLAYAASDEWHQSLVPSRTGSVADVGWDAAGAAVVLFAIWLAERRRAAAGSTKRLPEPA